MPPSRPQSPTAIDELRRRGRVVGAPQRDLHVERHRAGHEQQVREARRRGEVHAEALAVVDRVVDRVNLQLAAVAGAGVDLADRQAAAEALPDRLLEPRADLLDAGLDRSGQRLGDNPRPKNLVQYP